MKPYQRIPILECGEPLIPIPLELFAVEEPHPYAKLSAPYGGRSPYYLRQAVLEGLITAQDHLQQLYPRWRVQIFDAYRPIAVQQFMVDYTFAETARAQGFSPDRLTNEQRQAILEQVYQFWALPSDDPTMPPPHSTGAAVDVTLVNDQGQVVNMGSPIDELSPRSYPDHFATVPVDQSPQQQSLRETFHRNRQLLRNVMIRAGFRQHPREWWHFSQGDQMWAWLMNLESSDTMLIAHYGAV
ncbi:MAG: D-alanyl-D-alanine dipeptidase [Leptolyngbyaceae cyanobacterium RM2_2_4]|nr:D-alanyl-D-alanine dipeptidase [Leptolyngbyaceae cyanobacterium SM1_4_3]NJO48555.1 D-alanyl-D-alanine dipeptidase [Leptolyngbyaceae cyanobacterium RM2_2_4]